MSDSLAPGTTLKSQYLARVSSDLETNTQEQARITAEVTALQEQLTALKEDHALLLGMQQTLSSEAPATERSRAADGSTETAADPARPALPGARTSKDARRSTARAGKPATAKNTAAKTGPGGAPSLRDLVCGHVHQHNEPLSAAEVTTALTTAHPERSIKATVVRNTLENLVAKGHAQRTKQKNSVFYSPTTPAQEADLTGQDSTATA